MAATALHGLLNAYKPPGWTSMQVVERVRRLTHQRRAGHAGTLDPAASGVLPIGLGVATRVLEFFDEMTKEYRATVELGVVTDSYDGEGKIVERHDPSGIAQAQVEALLERFRGSIRQVPPMFSALKRGGVPLYKLARQGLEVPREERSGEVQRLELTAWNPPLLELAIECGRGVYLRSLAHDLGQALGCGAYLKKLVRRRSGPFELSSSITLEELAELCQNGRGEEALAPPDEVLLHWDCLILSPRNVAHLRQGQPVRSRLFLRGPPIPEGTRFRAYSAEGTLVALARYAAPLMGWQPFKVFPPSAAA